MLQPQANSRYCFVCGIENTNGLHLHFYQSPEGEVHVQTSVPAKFQGYPGIVHGGVVAAMLDEAAGRALMGIEEPRFMFTARLDISYRKTVPVDSLLRIIGRMGKRKSRSATAWAGIYDQSGLLLAEANAVLVDVPDGMLSGVDLESLGWKIYTDPHPAPGNWSPNGKVAEVDA